MNSSNCHEINLAIKFADLLGNFVKETVTGWTKANLVFYMQLPLSSELKEKIENEIPRLMYWRASTDTHYAPEEGFFCDECKTGISFPMDKHDVL